MVEDNSVKIFFRFFNKILDEETEETMWATVVDKDKGLYKLDNIPFYAPSVASDDIVFAEYDEEEQRLTYRSTVEYSGNSIIQVVLMDETKNITAIRDIFTELGCCSEGLNKRYFSMEVPAKIDYREIRQKLEELAKQNTIDFAEPCLSSQHRY